MSRIYLDNAATSWPKPDGVYAAIDHAQRVLGAPAGRGAYYEANDASRVVDHARNAVAKFINAPKSRNIAFTFNGTDSLSTAILGLLKKGDHVVTTVVEHNSVLRPLNHLEASGLIKVTCVGCNEEGFVDVDELIAAITPKTRLLAVNHVSNVTGSIQPVDTLKKRLAQLENQRLVYLLDAAQSLGHIPVDIQELGCDILASSGHKGLLGPLGTGLIYLSDRVVNSVDPLRFGGTGTEGSIEFQPDQMPDRFESGNLNVPGIAGVHAGIRFLNSTEGLELRARRYVNATRLLQGILKIPGVEIHGAKEMDHRIGVFSFNISGWDCHEVASVLDANWAIQTRAGRHCAPLIHRALGTESEHGTVRLSVGLFTTLAQAEMVLESIAKLADQSTP
ncbi:aminotransferase class V-fold PLP-dependent enzyme [Mariniblastus sp.]|nr:aminotransferase class V-fold PLP-dependent enzyme [Mariniblastus sp.]MDA7926257.1 aminotransferase class V-fold PLP-dependent enzyme [Mariniblastus sp.]MDB4396542.1 aminotransferase class V-fold PLP-dependent enzyme [bacterium]MDC0294616.1 aminotransferase class V-fold PLP-dependent enzyme [Mariniblastus sp.]